MKKLLALTFALAVAMPTPAIAETVAVPRGWFEIRRGVYGKWCGRDCVNVEAISGGSRFIGLTIWCRDFACGQTYGTVSFYNGDGVVVDQKIRSARIGKGQKVVLPFESQNQTVESFSLDDVSMYRQ